MTTEQQLPKGWEIKRLGDVLKIQNGYAFKSVEFIKENPKNTHIPLIRQSQLVGNTVDLSDCIFLDKKYLSDKKNYIVNKGDILIGMSGSIGKVSFYEDERPALLNQRVGKLNLYNHDTFQKDFFAYLLINLEQSIIQTAKGMGVQKISSKDIEQLQIPIPPFDTQQAIVNKIESLFDEIDEGIGRLKTAAQQIQQYRQSLLKNAFNGELTKEWRSKHADALPSENELLAQIQTTREQHHAQQLADWQTAVSQWEQNGKEGKKPSKPKKLREFIQLEGNFSNLPKGWCWVELSGISSVIRIGPFGTLLHKADYISNQIPLINPSHIKNGKIIPDFQLTVSKEKLKELNNYIMRENDIVIGRRGEMGRCAVVTSNENGWLCGTGSMFVRPLNSVSSEFYAYIISSERVKDYLSNSSSGTTMQNLNEKILQTVPVPLCSIQEQLEILRILDTNFTACDQLAAELAKQLKQAELLKQAVLKAAFSGSLLDK